MMLGVLTFPVLILSLYGLGEWLRWRILGSEPFSIGRIARAMGFGILAHGLLMTLLGFTWLLRPPIAAILTALPAIVFWRTWWRDLRSIFTRRTWRSDPSLNLVEIVFGVMILGLLLIRGFNALAPNISWDATSHHYLVPSVWLKSGRVSDLPSVVFSYYPSLTEIGIAGTMALGRDFLSNLYGWLFGLLAPLLLIGTAARHFDGSKVTIFESGRRKLELSPGRFAGVTAALLFTLFPGVGVQAGGGYVDLPLACWVLLAIDFLLEFHSRRAWSSLIAAGLFAGAALSTKHLALIIFPGFLVFLIWTLLVKKDNETGEARGRWKYFLAFIAIALLIPLPWYLRSAWLTGNPLYPFGVFGLPTPPQPPFTSASWVRPDYHRSLIGFLAYWLYLTFEPTVGNALGRNYSLAFLLLLPLIVMFPRLKPQGRLLTVLAALSVLVIYALFPVETRYHLPLIAPIALALGLLAAQFAISRHEWLTPIVWLLEVWVILNYLPHVPGPHRSVAVTTVDLIFIAALALTLARSRNLRTLVALALLTIIGIGSLAYDIHNDIDEVKARYKVVLNLEPEDRYLIRCSPRNYGTIHHINTEMDWRNTRILCLEPRVYRLKADWVTWFGLKEPVVPTTPAENVAIWYRGGFTHILLGDDVQAKALMYYNIMHVGGWDVPGATPEEMIEYLHEHPDEDKVYLRLPDLWVNFAGAAFLPRNRHFTLFWLGREIRKEQYPTERVNGVRYYVASRLEILTSPERLAQYAFLRGFHELVDSGGLKIVYDDNLTFLFECDYPAYLRSHPEVDLETLGLR